MAAEAGPIVASLRAIRELPVGTLFIRQFEGDAGAGSGRRHANEGCAYGPQSEFGERVCDKPARALGVAPPAALYAGFESG